MDRRPGPTGEADARPTKGSTMSHAPDGTNPYEVTANVAARSDAPPLPYTESKWPTPVGVICLVFGILGLLGGVYAIFTLPITRFFMRLGELGQKANPANDATIRVLERWHLFMTASALVSMVLSAVLLTVGIAILKRKGWCKPIALIWAAGQSIAVIVNAVIGFQVQQETMELTMEWAGKDAPEMAQITAGITRVIGPVSVVIGCVFGLALPVFLAVWMTRPKITEEIATWNGDKPDARFGPQR
jgi:hypothetical protein